MSLQDDVMTAMKTAMKEKNQTALEALRAIKSAILIANTTGNADALSEDAELKLLQKLVKQRKDSAAIYKEQNRTDLAEPELAQAEVISQFLPKQLSETEIENAVLEAITKTGAQSMKDMGKVMGIVNTQLAGRADGKTISNIVKAKLS